ncbi:MAG: hypothetical protein H9789_13705 [Candidatus Paraprevotella stercoravium]|uniref:Uncharacterized protein n=1 Tax=Candidatus Paraprevotella stercoravium TaxID=2838725 RepID=A0A9E2P585_9BACT|nr:hypothetical protein [Candidatus Paraprevotella stercoravium]
MKRALVIIMVMAISSCTKVLPEKEAETRSGEKQEGIMITVDTTATEYEYEFDIKI